MLGIIIGTASVIALVGSGPGQHGRRHGRHSPPRDDRRDRPECQAGRFAGSTRPTWVVNYGLTWADFDQFELIDTVIGQVPMRIFPQEISHVGRKVSARVVATTEPYAKINRLEMAVGRFLRDGADQADEGDAQRMRNVVVLGAGVARDLFPFEAAVGQSVVINKAHYLIGESSRIG